MLSSSSSSSQGRSCRFRPSGGSSSAGDEAIRVAAASVELMVSGAGRFTLTTVTLVAQNVTSSELEAELEFPIEDSMAFSHSTVADSTVCSYAVDIGDRMVSAVVCGKQEARRAFEQEIFEQKIVHTTRTNQVTTTTQATILEKVQGNYFRTRIYPIHPLGRRVVQVVYLTEVDTCAFQAHFSLHIPTVVSTCSFSAQVLKPVFHIGELEAPLLVCTGSKLDSLRAELKDSGMHWSSNFTQNEVTPDWEISVLYPKQELIYSTEKDTNGNSFFCLSVIPPQVPTFSSSEEASMKRIGLWWDCSLSQCHDVRSPLGTNKCSLLISLVKQMCPVVVDVFTFSNVMNEYATVTVLRPSDTMHVTQVLDSIEYDGATNFGCLNFQRANSASKYTLHVVESDGLGSLHGLDTSPHISRDVPIFTIGCPTVTGLVNHDTMKRISLPSGGSHFSLSPTSDTTSIARQITSPSKFCLSRIIYEPSHMADVVPCAPYVIPSGTARAITLTGRLLTEGEINITLEWGYPQKPCTSRNTYRLPNSFEAPVSALLCKFWAKKTIEGLYLENTENSRRRIVELCSNFGFVSDNTSLILLESLEQYLKYKIKPPPSLPEVLSQYNLKMLEFEAEKSKKEMEKKAYVNSLWKKRSGWWKCSYSGSIWQSNILHQYLPKPGSVWVDEELVGFIPGKECEEAAGVVSLLLSRFDSKSLLSDVKSSTTTVSSAITSLLENIPKIKLQMENPVTGSMSAALNDTLSATEEVMGYALTHKVCLPNIREMLKHLHQFLITGQCAVDRTRDTPRDSDLLSSIEEVQVELELALQRRASEILREDSVLGISFGRSYIAACGIRQKGTQVVTFPDGFETLPTVISFMDDGISFGEIAMKGRHDNPSNTVDHIRDFLAKEGSDDIHSFPFDVTEKDGNPVISVSVRHERMTYLPLDIAVKLLSHVKTSAENFLSCNVKSSVLTVPPYFDDAQRRALKDAGTLAGLNVLRIINEPTAATVAYNLGSLPGTTKVLVVDCGATTTSVTVIVVEDGTFEVIGWARSDVGGCDFDKCLVTDCLNYLLRTEGMDLSSNSEAVHKLTLACIEAKHALSSRTNTQVYIEGLVSYSDFNREISRPYFEHLCAPLFSRLLETMKNSLKESKTEAAEIGHAVFVGGSTLMPKLVNIVETFVPKAKLHNSLNPAHAVATGACMQACILTGHGRSSSSGVQDLLLLDVTPLSLGIACSTTSCIGADSNNRMAVLVPRNTTIPTKKSAYFPIPQNLGQIKIEVYEGERADVRNNNRLGAFFVDCGHVGGQVEVTFDIDANGILVVSAVNPSVARRCQITITNDKGRLSKEDIERMVAEADNYSSSTPKTFSAPGTRAHTPVPAAAPAPAPRAYCGAASPKIPCRKKVQKKGASVEKEVLEEEEGEVPPQQTLGSEDFPALYMDDEEQKDTSSFSPGFEPQLPTLIAMLQQNCDTIPTTALDNLMAIMGKKFSPLEIGSIVSKGNTISLEALGQLLNPIRPHPKPCFRPSKENSIYLPPATAGVNVIVYQPQILGPWSYSLFCSPCPYQTYLIMRNDYSHDPVFFFECSSFFQAFPSLEMQQIAITVISNLAELELESIEAVRLVGYMLDYYGMTEQAVELFKYALDLKPEEPQSHRDYALAVAQRGRPGDYTRAVEELSRVLLGDWNIRFTQIEATALMELGRITQLAEAVGERVDSSAIPLEFCALPIKMRVVLTWATDLSDLELWVEDPSGEICYPMHNLTRQGGLLSKDFTHGYGPQEFLLREAKLGIYKIKVRHFSSYPGHKTTAAFVHIFTNFCSQRPNEKEQHHKAAVWLGCEQSTTNKPFTVDVATVRFGDSTKEIHAEEVRLQYEAHKERSTLLKPLTNPIPANNNTPPPAQRPTTDPDYEEVDLPYDEVD